MIYLYVAGQAGEIRFPVKIKVPYPFKVRNNLSLLLILLGNRDCCLSCSLGILVASMGQSCSRVADMFGCPLEQPFSDCCEEMAAPFANDTLDDLLSSLEESTTELASTTTEAADDVCPEGFSHNAEMNVCDDLNEVSGKLVH